MAWNLKGSYVETCSCELMEVEDIVPFGVETGEPVRFSGMFHPVGSDLTMAGAKRSRISAFGIEYEARTGLSKSEFAWAA